LALRTHEQILRRAPCRFIPATWMIAMNGSFSRGNDSATRRISPIRQFAKRGNRPPLDGTGTPCGRTYTGSRSVPGVHDPLDILVERVAFDNVRSLASPKPCPDRSTAATSDGIFPFPGSPFGAPSDPDSYYPLRVNRAIRIGYVRDRSVQDAGIFGAPAPDVDGARSFTALI
jgi:hypothetical protein